MQAFKIVHKKEAVVLVVFADAGTVTRIHGKDWVDPFPKKYFLAKDQSSNKIFLLSAEDIAKDWLFMNFFDIKGDIK